MKRAESYLPDIQQRTFVNEYLKDFDPSRAAVAAGYSSDQGFELRLLPEIAKEVHRLVHDNTKATYLDSEWILLEMLDNHRIARQMGNLNASNKALDMLAKHSKVDAYAAEKIQVQGDDDLMQRLRRKQKPVDFCE